MQIWCDAKRKQYLYPMCLVPKCCALHQCVLDAFRRQKCMLNCQSMGKIGLKILRHFTYTHVPTVSYVKPKQATITGKTVIAVHGFNFCGFICIEMSFFQCLTTHF